MRLEVWMIAPDSRQSFETPRERARLLQRQRRSRCAGMRSGFVHRLSDLARGPARYAVPLILSKTRFLRKRFRSKISAGL